MYHRHDEKGLNWEPGGVRSGAGVCKSGVHLRIREPWFDGDSGEPWQARHQVADALKVHLAYRRSVALADISTAVDNVFVQTPQGYLLSNNSVLVYDNVYGGLGLTEALWWSLEEYAKQLLRGADRDRRRWDRINIFPENARKLVSWLNEVNDEPDPSPDEPGPDDWWRIIRPGSQVRLYQRDRDALPADSPICSCLHAWGLSQGSLLFCVSGASGGLRRGGCDDFRPRTGQIEEASTGCGCPPSGTRSPAAAEFRAGTAEMSAYQPTTGSRSRRSRPPARRGS